MDLLSELGFVLRQVHRTEQTWGDAVIWRDVDFDQKKHRHERSEKEIFKKIKMKERNATMQICEKCYINKTQLKCNCLKGRIE